MVYDKVLIDWKYLEVVWYSDAPFCWEEWAIDIWPCGCVWLVLWKLRINIMYKDHDKTEEIE